MHQNIWRQGDGAGRGTGRIVFYHPFPKGQLSGGIKTIYHHCVLLNQMGMESLIYAVDGPSIWLEDPALAALVRRDVQLGPTDILVFPEVVTGVVEEVMQQPLPCRKIMFCQGTYIFLGFYKDFKTLKSWGVEAVAVPGHSAKQALETVYGTQTLPITVIPPFIDQKIFHPPIFQPGLSRWQWMKHNATILSFSRKWVAKGWAYGELLKNMFTLKYPEFSSVPWLELDDMNIGEAGDAMRNATICLSLARLEGFGLTALEVMACGTPVVGFHGGGGLDYARPDNGYWHSPEDLEGVIESMALILRGVLQEDAVSSESTQQKCLRAQETAQSYTEEKTRKALWDFYYPFFL